LRPLGAGQVGEVTGPNPGMLTTVSIFPLPSPFIHANRNEEVQAQ